MDNHIVETTRLILQPITQLDFDNLYQMYQNPKVMKYIYDGSTFTREQAKIRVNNFITHWQRHGFGMWSIYEKQTSQFIGYGGFRYFDDSRPEFYQKIELGYIFDEPHWGKGYASEAISACVQAGLQYYNFDKILATILPENIASQIIASKAGLIHSFNAEFAGETHWVYQIERD